MISKLPPFLILFIFLVNPSIGQETFKSITIDTDTVNSSWIKEQINNDSLRILEYQKIRYTDMPDIIDERIVYVDLQKSILFEEIKKYSDQLTSILKGESYYIIQRTSGNENVINPYKQISDTYVQIHKLNNEYILFLPDFNHLRIISDSAFMYKDDESLLCYYLNEINKINDSYEINYHDFQHKICQKTIQSYDRNKEILVWKETHIANGDQEFTNYRMYIPITEAISYPLLNIINTGGLDDVYDKFDNLDLEKLFKK